MFSTFGKVLKNESGATGVECGPIADPIFAVAIAASTMVGAKLATMATNTANRLD